MTQNRNQGDNKNQMNQGSSTRTDPTGKKMGSGADEQSRKVASPTSQSGSSASASSTQNRDNDQTRGGSSQR